MGIKGVNKKAEECAPDAFFTMMITLLSGLRIAIDGNNWMYTNRATARKRVINKTDIALGQPDEHEIRREWFLMAINFVIGWLSHDITPVFCFDGKAPVEKDGTKAERQASRTAAKEKIDSFYEQLKGDVLAQPVDIMKQLRTSLLNYNFIPYEDFELFKMIIKGIGVPTLQARGDGEHLCSALCVDGKVAAVFSTDTDNLVYGCPLLITGFSTQSSYDENGFKVQHLDCVRLDRMLTGLKLKHEQFVDFCIMCGCDFNTNMPQCAVGRSYPLIQQYGSIDNLPPKYDTKCLNHHRCREIFKYVPNEELIVHAPVIPDEPTEEIYDFPVLPEEAVNPLNINKRAIATARDYLEMVGVSGQIERIILAYNNAVVGKDGHVQSLNLVLAPHYVPPPVLPVPHQKVTLNILPRVQATPVIQAVPITQVVQTTPEQTIKSVIEQTTEPIIKPMIRLSLNVVK